VLKTKIITSKRSNNSLTVRVFQVLWPLKIYIIVNFIIHEINRDAHKLVWKPTLIKKIYSKNNKPSSFVTCMIDYLADIWDYFLFKIIFKNIKKKDKTFKKHGFNIFPKGQWVTEQSNSNTTQPRT